MGWKDRYPDSVYEQEWARIWAEAELNPELKDTLQKDLIKAVLDFNQQDCVETVHFKKGYTKIYNLNLVDAYDLLLQKTAQDLYLIWHQ